MRLQHIGDSEKFEGSRVVVDGWRSDAPAISDGGSYYGILRQAGDTHDQAIAALRALISTWHAGGSTPSDPRQPVHIGNDVKVRLADVAVPIIETHEGTDIAATLFDIGTQFGQVVQATGSIDFAFSHVGGVLVAWYGVERPFPEVAEPRPGGGGGVPGQHINPLRGYLKSTDRGWTHDGGQPAAPVGLMCGDALLAKSEGKDILNGILRPAARAGYQFTMPWSPLIWRRGQGGRFWGDRTFSPLSVPEYWQHVREWINWSKELGMKTFLAHGGLAGATNAEEDAHADELGNLIQEVGPEWVLFPMMGNEIRDTSDRDDLDPREHARIIRRIHDRFPEIPYVIGSWTGDPLPVDVQRLTDALRTFAPESRHCAFHAHRHGDFAQKIRRMWNCMFENYKNIAPCGINDENVGPQGRNGHLSDMQNAHEIDRHFMCGVLGINVLARTLVNFTCSPSVIFDESFEDIPGFFEAPAFAREIPVRAVAYRHALHSGDRAGSRRIFRAQGDIRIDGRIDDNGEFAFLAYGQDVRHIGSQLTLDKPAEFELVNTDREVFQFRLGANQRIPSVPVNKLYLLRGRQG